MNKNSFDQLNFDKKFRLSRRTIFLGTATRFVSWELRPQVLVLYDDSHLRLLDGKLRLEDSSARFRFWLEQITRENSDENELQVLNKHALSSKAIQLLAR